MKRTTLDLLAGLLGMVVMLGVLALVTQATEGDDGADVFAATSGPVSDDPGDGSELTIATTTTTTQPVTTTAESSTTTTIAVEVTTIVSLESSEPELWEDAASCVDRPRRAVIRATVAGPHRVVEGFLGWAVDGPDFEMTWVDMVEVEEGVFAVEIGPFAEDSVADGSAERILIAVEVADETEAGAYDDSSLFLQLWDCEVAG